MVLRGHLGIDPAIVVHRLNVDPEAKSVRQKKRAMDVVRNATTVEEVEKLLKVGFIHEVQYQTSFPSWSWSRKPMGGGKCM